MRKEIGIAINHLHRILRYFTKQSNYDPLTNPQFLSQFLFQSDTKKDNIIFSLSAKLTKRKFDL